MHTVLRVSRFKQPPVACMSWRKQQGSKARHQVQPPRPGLRMLAKFEVEAIDIGSHYTHRMYCRLSIALYDLT